MTPLSREARASRRFLALRIGLFFLGAGTWVAGMLAGSRVATDVAILILAIGLVLGLVARRRPEEGTAEQAETDE